MVRGGTRRRQCGSNAVDDAFEPLKASARELPINTGRIEVSVPRAGYFAAPCRWQAPCKINPVFGNRVGSVPNRMGASALRYLRRGAVKCGYSFFAD